MVPAGKVFKQLELVKNQILKNYTISEDEAARAAFYLLIKKIHHLRELDLQFVSKRLEKFIKIKEDLDCENLTKNLHSLDNIYENFISKVWRKSQGQFFTPPEIAELMAGWGLKKEENTVLDPSVGTGVFISTILEMKNKRGKICAVDIDPLVLNISNLKSHIIGNENFKINFINDDFLKYDKDRKFDFVICNPPYKKFHNFDRRIINQFESDYSLRISKLTNIYALFFIRAFYFLKKNGLAAFITPSEFLYTNYGRDTKKFLLDNFTIEAFILINSKKVVFNGVLTSAIITLLKKKSPEKNHKIKFIHAKKIEDVGNMLAVLGDEKEGKDLVIRKRPQYSLDPKEKWLYLFEEEKNLDSNKLIPLKDIDEVRRGIATGHNDFFTLNLEQIRKWGIEPKYLKPVLTNARQCKNYDFDKSDFETLKKTNGKVFLLYCFEEPSKNLNRYINYGKKRKVHKRYLTSKRSPWFSMEKREPAPILATVFSRNKMRFIHNKSKALNLAAFHGIYPKFKDENKIKALLAYLNSGEAKKFMFLQKRAYGGGLDKFEPGDLKEILIMDVNKISSKEINLLAKKFDELCAAARISFKKENLVREEIDCLVKNIIKSID